MIGQVHFDPYYCQSGRIGSFGAKRLHMLCEICKKREAELHLTQDVGAQVKQVAVCEKCLRNAVPPELAAMLLARGSPLSPDGPLESGDK
jgi:hypothetical protein